MDRDTGLTVLGEAVDQVRLVLGVARMGERDLFGWWRSHGLSITGSYVLSNILPRTWALSALELDVVSAARRHDETLRRQSAVHLFSDLLPFKHLTLEWLAGQKLEPQPHELVEALRAWTPATARGELYSWAGEPPPTAERVGEGLCLGSLSAADLEDSAQLDHFTPQLAAGYVASDTTLLIPYLDLT